MSTLTAVNSAGMYELGIRVPVENRFEYSVSESTKPTIVTHSDRNLQIDRNGCDARESSSVSLLTSCAAIALLILSVLTAVWTVYHVCSLWCSAELSDFLNHVAGFRIYLT